ncbi:hypothetical protein [Rubrolithibacter danxiaensis]|uniref:hypothetical protein n=1 Tax=Rubrolithibacter danxiaensis TaxID=3390805 RepID=UPI003BF89A1C
MRRLFYFLTVLVIGITSYYSWFYLPVAAGSPFQKVEDSRLDEISGMVFSKRNKGLIWVHNDGIQKVKLFLIDTNGHTKAVFKGNKWTFDWEDMAIDPGSVDGKSYLYAADIGDNFAWRDNIKVFRIPEPVIGDEQDLSGIETIRLRYPDGKHDAEAVLIDPLSKQLYIISKREKQAGIYSASLSFKDDGLVLLKKAGSLNLNPEGVKQKYLTAASISEDGLKVLLRSYSEIYYWDRRKGEKLEETLMREPLVIPYNVEFQGEAIAISPDDKGFYTLSEGEHVPLNYQSITSK